MKQRTLLPVLGLVTAATMFTGCANMSETQRGTAIGAGVGAATGAVIGRATDHSNTGRGAVIGGAIGAIAGNVWSRRMEEKRVAMQQATQGTGIEVSRTPNEELRVNVPADFSFDVGRADIKPQMRPVLDQFARGLDASQVVRVVGHTDNTGSDAINNPLSVNRANAVRDYLVMRGVPAARITTEGRGSYEPVADNTSEAGRARNRRVEIFLRDTQPAG
ncbi:OmpA family protein [Azohydromonas australica]|uniref:OmpA family protein n=1 Tax=Azohydromonas australica TaxID=364039 RepID=UPI000403A3E3|nr:OmpA family protein [Azohydromonas australica]